MGEFPPKRTSRSSPGRRGDICSENGCFFRVGLRQREVCLSGVPSEVGTKSWWAAPEITSPTAFVPSPMLTCFSSAPREGSDDGAYPRSCGKGGARNQEVAPSRAMEFPGKAGRYFSGS